MSSFLDAARHEFTRHKSLADQALAHLDDEAFFHRPGPQVNSVALIVKHLAGNLRSRWSDFLHTDGEKPDRHRDGEFQITPQDTRASLLAAWEAGWSEATGVLQQLTPADLEKTITIRGEEHTVTQAILRGASHAAYHVGQILYLARLLHPTAPWLTIAPGKSGAARDGYLSNSSSSPILESNLRKP